jgi:hypothetical protein
MKHWNENLYEKVIIGSRNNKQRDWNIMNSKKFIESLGVNYTHWQNLSAKHFSPAIPITQMDNALRSFHLDLSNTTSEWLPSESFQVVHSTNGTEWIVPTN